MTPDSIRPSIKDNAYRLAHRFRHDSVARTLELTGERWTMLVIREAFFGVRRYSDFAHNLNIPRPTLSNRLALLVDAGILRRERYAGGPVRDEYHYRLTDAGRDLFPVILALMRWGDTYLTGPDGLPLLLTHESCGKVTHPIMTCDQCGETVNAHNIHPDPGPGFSASAATSRSLPPRGRRQ
jgi:DNA-binding HxlR family transcriptional regulator